MDTTSEAGRSPLINAMARLKNRFNVPSIPVFWTDPANGHRVEWRTATETFHTWIHRVWAYCDGNSKARPSEDTLDEVACAQIPRSYCNGAANTQAHMVASGAGCSSCGGRHR